MASLVKLAKLKTQEKWSGTTVYSRGKSWKMADEVPGWGITKDRFDEFIGEI